MAISYQSSREQIKEARGRFRRNFKTKRNTEAFVDSLMEERRRMDDFEADLFKYIAREEGGQDHQMQGNPVAIENQRHESSPDM